MLGVVSLEISLTAQLCPYNETTCHGAVMARTPLAKQYALLPRILSLSEPNKFPTLFTSVYYPVNLGPMCVSTESVNLVQCGHLQY